MRLRVRCSAHYELGDLQWCMVHVPDHLHTVRDLATHISKLLELGKHRVGEGTEPPQVLLDGFIVPHEEEVHAVLRDDEVIDAVPSVLTSHALPLAAEPAWSSPCVASSPVNGKRPSEVGVTSQSDAKRPRAGGKGGGANTGGAPAVMAIGWQSPEAAAKTKTPNQKTAPAAPQSVLAAPPAAPTRTTAQVEESSDEDDSGEEEAAQPAPSKQAALPSADARKGSGKGNNASAAAKAAAQATCNAAAAGEASQIVSGGHEESGTALFVGGLAQSVDDEQLRKHFEQYGQVASAEVVLNNATGKPKGFGFVEFVHSEARAKVLAAGPKLEIAGRMAEVKAKVAKGSGRGKEGKSKNSKGDGKEGKSKNGKGVGKGKGKKGKEESEGKDKQDSDSDEEESSEEEAPQKVPAPGAKATVAPNSKTKGTTSNTEAAPISSEELEVQRQMAALGLPVSFTASDNLPGGESHDDDDDDEDEET